MNRPLLLAEQRQQNVLSPRLQHAVRLLQMSSLDFAQEVEQALGRNPFLEPIEGEAGPDGEASAPAEDAPARDGPEADLDSAAGEPEREPWQVADGLQQERPTDGGDTSVLDTMAAETSLAAHLHGQLNLLALPARDLALARAIIDSLEDDGYLRIGLDEVTELTRLAMPPNLDPPLHEAEAQIALRRVQSLEPAGVAARDLRECLLLQLPAIACAAQRELMRRILAEQLDRLAANDVAALVRRLGHTGGEIDAACARIRRLDPHPGWAFGASRIPYVTPDVIARRHRGGWTAVLNPAIVPRVRVNETYAELFKRHREAHNGELAAHLREARWTLQNVAQRFSTIQSVAQAIIDRQGHFLEYGAMAMKPLALRDIAGPLGMHESTVSRVTNNKFIATPAGVFELKFFFSRPLRTASGGACSGTAIRGVIKDIIGAEKASRPLSDAEIARQLARQGLVVARRTVTKYRQLLRIEPLERRRAHA